MVASGSREEGLGVPADGEGVSLSTPPLWGSWERSNARQNTTVISLAWPSDLHNTGQGLLHLTDQLEWKLRSPAWCFVMT